jgi:1-aminocyclopropane-1-carboxylate deaminase
MRSLSFGEITTEPLITDLVLQKKISVEVLRTDKIHPVISGNKWFKLRYYLDDAIKQKKKTIVTFGGAYSNHIVATAAACKQAGFKSIGIIRGERAPTLTHSLKWAEADGMQLIFVSREEYKLKPVPAEIISEESYIINEGGFGEKGVWGAATILNHCLKENYSHFICAVGTGTMMAGIRKAAGPDQSVIGISVMKNNFSLSDNVAAFLSPEDIEKTQTIFHEYHFGGYAKSNPLLFSFMNKIYEQSGIPLDFVYTGKMFFAVMELIKKDFFPDGSHLLLIHSGGLQGNESLPAGTLHY